MKTPSSFRWFVSFLLASVFHLALWWLPVALPSIEIPPPPLRIHVKLPPPPALPPPPPPLPPPPPPRVRPPTPPKSVKPKRRTRRTRPLPPKAAPRPTPAKPPPVQPPPPAPIPVPAPSPIVARTSKALPSLPSVPSALTSSLRPNPPAPPTPPAPEVDLSGYRSSLGDAIEKQKRYPVIAQRMGFEGKVILLIRLSPQGRILRPPTVLRSSGYPMLDQEALRMIRVAPIPPLPSAFSRMWADFQIPILFALQD